MKAKYFIGDRRSIYGNHVMHKEGCPFLTDTDKVVNLGTFHSSKMARDAGKLRFRKIDVCLFCCKEFHKQLRKEGILKICKEGKILLSGELTITRESVLQSFLN